MASSSGEVRDVIVSLIGRVTIGSRIYHNLAALPEPNFTHRFW